MRGDHGQVRPLLDSALASVDTAEYLAFAARARHAAGIAAPAEGSHLTAYAQLSQLFDVDGTPLHHHVSYLAIADLAAAAARAERRLEVRMLVERALARVDGVSVRLLSPGKRDCVEPAQRKAGQRADRPRWRCAVQMNGLGSALFAAR